MLEQIDNDDNRGSGFDDLPSRPRRNVNSLLIGPIRRGSKFTLLLSTDEMVEMSPLHEEYEEAQGDTKKRMGNRILAESDEYASTDVPAYKRYKQRGV